MQRFFNIVIHLNRILPTLIKDRVGKKGFHLLFSEVQVMLSISFRSLINGRSYEFSNAALFLLICFAHTPIALHTPCEFLNVSSLPHFGDKKVEMWISGVGSSCENAHYRPAAWSITLY